MCLTINKNIHTERDREGNPVPLVAKEDILVLKGLSYHLGNLTKTRWPAEGYWITPFQKAIVKDNKIYEQQEIQAFAIAKNWFHNDGGGEPAYAVERGYHAIAMVQYPMLTETYWTSDVLPQDSNGELYQLIFTIRVAVIPKGTKYFLGVDGDIVAERMGITNMTLADIFDKKDIEETTFRSPQLRKLLDDELFPSMQHRRFDLIARKWSSWGHYSRTGDAPKFKKLTKKEIKERVALCV